MVLFKYMYKWLQEIIAQWTLKKLTIIKSTKIWPQEFKWFHATSSLVSRTCQRSVTENGTTRCVRGTLLSNRSPRPLLVSCSWIQSHLIKLHMHTDFIVILPTLYFHCWNQLNKWTHNILNQVSCSEIKVMCEFPFPLALSCSYLFQGMFMDKE